MSIQLYSKHKIATGIVDEADSDLACFNWGRLGNSPKYYVYRMENKRRIYLHRLVYGRMIGKELLPTEEVDHVNDNPLDNRRENLRIANRSQNMQNTKLRNTNSSGYKGVYFQAGKWVAGITHNYKYIYLGRHDTAELAYAAYCLKAKELFGEFFNPG